MIIEKLSPQDWKEKYMGDMYLDVFGQQRGQSIERCDFVLLVKNDDESPVGFVTCHELDSETLYWQFGGAGFNLKKSFKMINYYLFVLSWSLNHYKRITTKIKNTNTEMLRIALKCGFLVYGIWNFKNEIYLELCHEGGGI